MRKFIVAILTLTSILSCNNRPSKTEIRRFANQITSLETPVVQDRFFHMVTEAVHEAEQNKEVDTTTLRNLLDSANSENQQRISLIKSIREIDPEINLKQITLHYHELIDSALHGGYAEFIDVVNTPLSKTKGGMLGSLILPIGKKILTAHDEIIEASRKFDEKYAPELNGSK
jgi:hypothetical protein